MRITAKFSVEANSLGFKGTSQLLVGLASPVMTFEASANLQASSDTYSFGIPTLPALGAIGGDSSFEGYGDGDVIIPALTASGDGGFYVPVSVQSGRGYLKPLYSTGVIKVSSPGSGSAQLPALGSKGGEGNFGEGESYIQALRSFGNEGPATSVAEIFSAAYTLSGFAMYIDIIVYIDSSGQVLATIEATREVIQELLSTIDAADLYQVIGDMLISIDSEMTGDMYSSQTVTDPDDGSELPDIDSLTRVWAVNIDSGSSVQYDNYGYNSFFTRPDGTCYGVANDGIYKLEGDSDNGVPIEALISIGKSNFGSMRLKGIYNVYAGVSSENKMYLKVESSTGTYIYEARSNNTELMNQRFDLGRGLKSNYYSLTLTNSEGGDFDLESIVFKPINLSRKI